MIAAIAVVAGTAGLGVAGASGSSEQSAADATVYASENNGNCFTTSPSKPSCPGERGDVAIETGDTVTWNFDGSNSAHNAAAANDVPADSAWKTYVGPFVSSGAYSREFTKPGVYQFVCQAHVGMEGTITVTGEPIDTPTPTPTSTSTATPTVTATATPTATPSTQPSDPGTTTPPPTGGTQDLVKPTLRSLGAKGKRRAVTVRFRLSESATVLVRVKRGRKVVKSVTKQVAAGSRAITVRSSKLKKGRYKVEVRARDASGNVSTVASKSLRIKR